MDDKPRLSQSIGQSSSRARIHAIASASLAALASFLSLGLLWLVAIRPFYFPWGDEFALLVNSAKPFHPAVRPWFLQGFSNYFAPYPKWFEGGSDFIRPLVNLTYYGNSLLFGTHWERYLLSNYLFHALIVGSVVYLAQMSFRLDAVATLSVGLLTFFSPAFESQSLFLPSFAADSLDAVFVLAGSILLIDRRYVLAWLLLLAATLTKEMSWFAPVAAATIVLLFEARPLKRSNLAGCAAFLGLLVPIWALRAMAFGGHLGAYAFRTITSPRALLQSVVQGLAKWPGVPLSRSELGLGAASRPGLAGPWYSYLGLYAGVLISAIFWTLLLVSASRLWRDYRAARAANPAFRTDAILLLFLCGSLALPVFGSLSARFGAICYPLLVLFLVVTLSRFGLSNWKGAASLCVLLFVAVLSVVQKVEMLGPQRRNHGLLWAASRSYTEVLAQSSAPVVITLDDLSGSASSPRYVARFAGYRGRLIRGNDLQLDAECLPRLASQLACNRIDHSMAASCSFQTHVPDSCGAILLQNTNPDRLSARGEIPRSLPALKMRYHFEQVRPRSLEAQGLSLTIESTAPFAMLVPGRDAKYRLFQSIDKY